MENLEIVEGKLLIEEKYLKYSRIFEATIITLILASSVLL